MLDPLVITKRAGWPVVPRDRDTETVLDGPACRPRTPQGTAVRAHRIRAGGTKPRVLNSFARLAFQRKIRCMGVPKDRGDCRTSIMSTAYSAAVGTHSGATGTRCLKPLLSGSQVIEQPVLLGIGQEHKRLRPQPVDSGPEQVGQWVSRPTTRLAHYVNCSPAN